MQKQLKKFGFFGLNKEQNKNDLDQGINNKSKDKRVKYLYTKENSKDDGEKLAHPKKHHHKSRSHRPDSPKIPQVVEPDGDKIHQKREKHRKRGIEKQHREKRQTELFFVPSEELKHRHRKIHSKDRDGKQSHEHKHSKKRNEIEKYDQWMTKKEIYKLIDKSQSKKTSPTNVSSETNPLKKFFVFEPPTEEHSPKKKSYRKKEETIDVVFTREDKKPSQSHLKARKDSDLDRKTFVKDGPSIEMIKHSKKRRPRSVEKRIEDSGSNKKNKTRFIKLREEEAIKEYHHHHQFRSGSASHMQMVKNIRTSTSQTTFRNSKNLVRSFFHLVDIPPLSHQNDKKKSRQEKYYRSETQALDMIQTFSDSHKNYQDNTQEVEDIQKTPPVKEPVARKKRQLKAQTLVTEVHISPHTFRKVNKNKISRKSKIPVLNRSPSPKKRSIEKQLKIDTHRSQVDARQSSAPPTYRKNFQDEIQAEDGKVKKISLNKFSSKSDTQIEELPRKKSMYGVKPAKIVKIKSVQKQNVAASKEKKMKSVRLSLSSDKSSVNSKKSIEKLAVKKSPKAKKASVSNVASSSLSQTSKMQETQAKKAKIPKVASSVSKKLPKVTVAPKMSNASSSLSKNPSAKPSTDKKKSFRSSAKGSLSNSTFGDKSMDSAKNPTTFLLTKSYKDDDKWKRWQKRKMYSDEVRKNLQNKPTVPNSNGIPTQVLEVRYLTVSTEVVRAPSIASPSSATSDLDSLDFAKPVSTTPEKNVKEFFDDDLCHSPCINPIPRDDFNHLLAESIDNALDQILNENYDFLQKDFNFTAPKSVDSIDDFLDSERKCEKDWYELRVENADGLNEIYFTQTFQPGSCLNLGSQERIQSSCSAPGSEESGYSTIKSRLSFFKRPSIKALMEPPPPLTLPPSAELCEAQTETDKSVCSLELNLKIPVECKSLQASVVCSQKSVQIQRDSVAASTSYSKEGSGLKIEEVASEVVCVKKKSWVNRLKKVFGGRKDKLTSLNCGIAQGVL